MFIEPLDLFCIALIRLNPFNINPLKKLLEECVDFERVRRQDAVKLFLSATDVRTAKVKVFSGKELRARSTCWLRPACR